MDKGKKMKPATSTPDHSMGDLTMLNVSTISVISDKSHHGSSSVSKLKIQNNLVYGHNIALLALATTKIQEETLSKVTTENMGKRLALLNDVEKKRDHVAALKKRIEESKYFIQLSEELKRKKEKLGPVLDFVSGLQNVEVLKNSLDCGMPTKGFLTEPGADALKITLNKTRNMLEEACRATHQHEVSYSERAHDVTSIQNNLESIVVIQKRCNNTANVLKDAVIEKASLKILRQRAMKKENCL
ncbi:uncharacterized protein [Periplaneta americana]|uniref:uncharacterized protein n=1 Tax=Periplaneta americana TaxID=6978 RepID=UPI0037E9C4C8